MLTPSISFRAVQKAFASVLIAAVILASPGFAGWHAAAQTFEAARTEPLAPNAQIAPFQAGIMGVQLPLGSLSLSAPTPPALTPNALGGVSMSPTQAQAGLHAAARVLAAPAAGVSISPEKTPAPETSVSNTGRAAETGLRPDISVGAAAGALEASKIQPTAKAAEQAVRGVESASDSDSRAAADKQFSTLTGERSAATSENSAQIPVGALPTPDNGLSRPARAQGEETPQEKPPAPPSKSSFGKVFEDPERNRSFWRYILGDAIALLGAQMGSVGMPYLVSSFTKNAMGQHRSSGDASQAFQELVRQNRAAASIAQWVAQALSLATLPLFTRNSNGNLVWLPRAFWVRAAVMGSVVALFFFSGTISLSTGLWALAGLIGLHAYFFGISSTLESGGAARIVGDKSVSDQERNKASAILTFVAAAMTLVSPVIAGQLARLLDLTHQAWILQLTHRTEVSGAVIYAIAAFCTAITGFIYATVAMFINKKSQNPGKDGVGGGKTPILAAVKTLGPSLWNGVTLVLKDRFLRTLSGLTLTVSLFAVPLISNALPEYVGYLIRTHSGGIGSLLNFPVVGWLLQGMASTPMGYYGMMVMFSAAGSMAAAALLGPLIRLFNRFGITTSKSMVLPFYAIAALEVPLFWLMTQTHSIWLVLPLYGLQSLATGFGSMLIWGLHEKRLQTYPREQITKILAAEAMVAALASVLAAYVYGFVLRNIPITTSLLIAAIATTIYGAARVVSPWFFFTEEEVPWLFFFKKKNKSR